MKIAYPFSKINQISLYTKVRYPILYKTIIQIIIIIRLSVY
jgi:hypothetical protein